MLRISRIGLIAVLAMGWLFGSTLGADEPLEKSILGKWKIAEHKIDGSSSKMGFEGGTFSWDQKNLVALKTKDGKRLSFKFTPKFEDDAAKTFRFMIETEEDSVSFGGGGPRKGVGRVNEKGELEMLETRSAVDGFPPDFSDASKKKTIVWRMTREAKVNSK